DDGGDPAPHDDEDGPEVRAGDAGDEAGVFVQAEDVPARPGGDAAFAGGVIPLHEMERIMIKKGLEQTGGNRTQAADLLGISVRTLRNKLNEYREAGFNVAPNQEK
ncbi:MAG: sigma-54-dependent Fis family transcriptional regulator, partial [Desulfovibrio sp.]|nr:sigma-54-dependent Fis family transcriptional regulator [Desulfovibrio sp.]